MLLKEFIMVMCRNSGRYFNIANRSDFYHDFLRSLYEVKPEYPSFYENKVACLKYYKEKLGYLPERKINDESKEDTVLFKETEEEKYNALRSLIAQKNCPTIVYVSRTRRTIQLAEKLTSDGFGKTFQRENGL